MRERTVPAEKLYDKSEDYRADMDSFNPSVLSSYKRTEDEEDYPEEVKNDSDVCGDPVKHHIIPSSRGTLGNSEIFE
jgi:hypothetical protein